MMCFGGIILKSKMKIITLTVVSTTVILIFLSLFSPYNIIHKITEDNIVNDQGISKLFKAEEIEDVTYVGSRTYIISTISGEFVAVQKYYSFMNYKWFVYEKSDTWG
jgi:hypothetical protein